MNKFFAALAMGAVVLASVPAMATEVIQKNKRFTPDVVTVKKGQSVTFKNDDPFVHNVYSQTPGMAFDIQTQKAGESSVIKFDKVGEADVRCAIHPTMKMKVIVTE